MVVDAVPLEAATGPPMLLVPSLNCTVPDTEEGRTVAVSVSTVFAASGEAGDEFLARAIEPYAAVIGFDHRTLSVDPLANAKVLLALLRAPEAQCVEFDVICHSRGGLVVRSLVEYLLPSAAWSGSINKVVFVAVPNAGTNLAEPQRWSKGSERPMIVADIIRKKYWKYWIYWKYRIY